MDRVDVLEQAVEILLKAVERQQEQIDHLTEMASYQARINATMLNKFEAAVNILKDYKN